MKKGYKQLLIICLGLIIILILNIIFNILDKKLYILFLLILFLGLIFLIGIEKDEFLYKKDVLLLVIISCLFYLVITYALGLYIGFIRNGYKLTFLNIAKNITIYSIIIYLEELIRYNLVKKGSRNISILILVLIISILMDITLVIKGFDLKNNYLLIEFFLSHFLPSLFKNFFLIYATYKAGFKTGIIYRTIMELPIYFMPLFPKLGIYVESIFKILFPMLLVLFLYNITRANKTKNNLKNYQIKKAGSSILIVLMVILIIFNCGWFKFYSLTIGSGSMSPNINKGDIVIVEKLNKKELIDLVVGDVLVFNKGDKILIHRIVEIKIIDNKYQIYTKGDANTDIDRFITEDDEVIGIAKFRLMYIGYPTVWLSELINKNE